MIAKLHRNDLVICNHSREGKTPSCMYTQIKTVSFKSPGPGCSKLTTSLVNVSLKFQVLIPGISNMPIFFCFALQKLFSFFQQKISVYFVIKW